MVNRWNFLQWTELNTPVSNLANVGITNVDRYELPILAGDNMAFYINFDTLISVDTDDWQLSLFDCNFNRVSGDFGVSKDIVTGIFHNLYSELTIPVLSRYDTYYLVIHDQYLLTAYYVSNPLRYISSVEADDKTYIVEYNHPSNIYNFFYNNIPSFTNKFRIHLNISKPIPKENATGYQLIDGTFKTARSTSWLTKEFITLWFDEFAHNAFHSMIKHDNIIIDNTAWRRNENDEYQIEWSENYKKSEGMVRLDDLAYAISNKMC